MGERRGATNTKEWKEQEGRKDERSRGGAVRKREKGNKFAFIGNKSAGEKRGGGVGVVGSACFLACQPSFVWCTVCAKVEEGCGSGGISREGEERKEKVDLFQLLKERLGLKSRPFTGFLFC